jgi:hypothetical protein
LPHRGIAFIIAYLLMVLRSVYLGRRGGFVPRVAGVDDDAAQNPHVITEIAQIVSTSQRDRGYSIVIAAVVAS